MAVCGRLWPFVAVGAGSLVVVGGRCMVTVDGLWWPLVAFDDGDWWLMGIGRIRWWSVPPVVVRLLYFDQRW